MPFLDGELYGLADADGKMLLTPQFEEIEMMDGDLPIFKANKSGKWPVYDHEGRQILPFSVATAWPGNP